MDIEFITGGKKENGRNSISNSPKRPLANYLNELLLLAQINVKGHMHQ